MAAGVEAGPQDCFAQLDRGARLGGYRVRRVLSRGNGGALHQAKGPDGTRVLLRILGPRARVPEARARLEADLERLARVDHRCVARLVGRAEDHFALEHPGGLTLLELIRRGRPFDAAEVVWIGHGLASGLRALHAVGLSHGNVSPSAIHVTEDGPVLVDLGWPARLGVAGAQPPSPAGDVRALASSLTFAVVGAPSEPKERVHVAGLPKEVASLLRAALDPTAPAPALEKLRRVFERAADALGLLDGAGAPATLGRRLREAIRLHASGVSSVSEEEASSADTHVPLAPGPSSTAPGPIVPPPPLPPGPEAGTATEVEAPPEVVAAAREPSVAPLQVESLALDVSSEERAALPEGPPSAFAETVEGLLTGEPPRIRTPSGRIVPQNPFASADLVLDRPSSTGSQDGAAPTDLELRHGLELIHRRVLGQGGMGVVHLVLDPRLGRRAALKLLRTPVTPSRVRRFRRETVVTARLDHPCIPPVYEAGATPSGTHYLLMRFVEGESLAEILTRRQAEALGERERAALARELLHALVKVGEAVAYAHDKGIVHRDLKPANIMIGAFGEVLVMDWGLARDLHESSDEDAWIRTELGVAPPAEPAPPAAGITQDGAILGTPGYLAPEQARGEDVDARADVFSLGAVLCEILTGRPPVIGPTTLAILGLTRGGEVEFPRQRFVDVDPELDAIARKALAPDAEARYPTADAFATDLRNYLEGRNVSAYRYRPTERLARALRRHPAIVALAAAALVLWGLTHGLLERARVEQDKLRAEQREEVRRRVTDLLVEAELSLDDKRYAHAQTVFLQALTLDDGSERARQGQALAERLEAAERRRAAEEAARRQEVERSRHEAQQVSDLLARGAALLAAGDLAGARRAHEQALGFDDQALAAARDALALLGERLERAEEDARDAAQRARDAEQAARFLEAGGAHLAAGRFREAQASLFKALAFGSPDAQPLLLRVEEGLVAERTREVQAELERREAEQAARLVERAAEALARGRLEEARTAFIQALGFDGKSEAARKGLLEADRALHARAEAARAEEARRERVRRVRRSQEQARAALARARELDRAGASEREVREQYLAALDAHNEALFLLPDDPGARQEKVAVARELAQRLFEDGHQELAQFVLRLAGAEAEAAGAGLDPLRDPDLVVIEADRVRIAHAFDGPVRFLPSRAFDRVREYVRSFRGRYRVVVQVRSEATRGNPPRVHATGLWLRVEDRQNNTVHPTIKLEFEGGPYVRPVTVDPSGRTVTPFERTLSLDTERYVREVEAALRRLLEPPQ
ncbi:MAG: protein kinase [Planctomycetes bacterium]|nr:protein kinase [Planctomycetota bacterium]